MRILVVEDDPRLAALILEGLGEDGLISDLAINASMGLSMSELETFDVLILDVMLPEGREAGFEMARQIRARSKRPCSCAILAVSGAHQCALRL